MLARDEMQIGAAPGLAEKRGAKQIQSIFHFAFGYNINGMSPVDERVSGEGRDQLPY